MKTPAGGGSGDNRIADPLAWAMSSRAADGAESGDLSWVVPRADGVLLAVVDGLGHGHRAALAARAAGQVLRAHADLEMTELVEKCHRALRKTRGVAMTLVWIAPGRSRMTWLGVGTVRAIVWRPDNAAVPACERLVLFRGVVGHQLPSMSPTTVPLLGSETVVLATDGVDPAFTEDPVSAEDPGGAADRILATYATGTDDALVLVASYRHGAR